MNFASINSAFIRLFRLLRLFRSNHGSTGKPERNTLKASRSHRFVFWWLEAANYSFFKLEIPIELFQQINFFIDSLRCLKGWRNPNFSTFMNFFINSMQICIDWSIVRDSRESRKPPKLFVNELIESDLISHKSNETKKGITDSSNGPACKL